MRKIRESDFRSENLSDRLQLTEIIIGNKLYRGIVALKRDDDDPKPPPPVDIVSLEPARFDGVNDGMILENPSFGFLDDFKFTFLTYATPKLVNKTRFYLGRVGNNFRGVYVSWHGDVEEWIVIGRNSLGTEIFRMNVPFTPAADRQLFAFSVDMEDQTSLKVIQQNLTGPINDITSTAVVSTFDEGSLDANKFGFSVIEELSVGAIQIPGWVYDGSISELYVKMGSYVNFADPTEQNNWFHPQTKSPLNLVTQAGNLAIPNPEILFFGPVDDWNAGDNKGTEQDFTVFGEFNSEPIPVPPPIEIPDLSTLQGIWHENTFGDLKLDLSGVGGSLPGDGYDIFEDSLYERFNQNGIRGFHFLVPYNLLHLAPGVFDLNYLTRIVSKSIAIGGPDVNIAIAIMRNVFRTQYFTRPQTCGTALFMQNDPAYGGLAPVYGTNKNNKGQYPTRKDNQANYDQFTACILEIIEWAKNHPNVKMIGTDESALGFNSGNATITDPIKADGVRDGYQALQTAVKAVIGRTVWFRMRVNWLPGSGGLEEQKIHALMDDAVGHSFVYGFTDAGADPALGIPHPTSGWETTDSYYVPKADNIGLPIFMSHQNAGQTQLDNGATAFQQLDYNVRKNQMRAISIGNFPYGPSPWVSAMQGNQFLTDWANGADVWSP